nr:hypothetical protein [Tanacetum cinerariifolium]
IIEKRVKVNQKARNLELKQRTYEEYCYDILYVISIKEDTAYPCPRIYSVSMKNVLYVKIDDPDIIMEEYVQLETERTLRNGNVYNWETTTYDKI